MPGRKRTSPGRRQDDLRLLESEARYRTLTEHLTELVYRADPVTFVATFVNHAVLTIYGYSPHEWVANPSLWADTIHPDDRERVLAEFVEAQRHGASAVVEYRVVRRDGDLRWVIDRFGWERNSQGTIVSLVGVMSDITERRRIEGRIRESEEWRRLFIEQAPAAIAMFDCDMRYLAASRRWVTDYGLERTELVGRVHYDVFPEIPEHWRAVHARGMAGEIVRADEDVFARPARTDQCLRWEVRPWHKADGSIGGIVIFTEDITERKRAEEALRASESRLINILETTPSGILLIDASGEITYANPTAERLAGLTPHGMVGRRYNDPAWVFITPDGRPLPDEERLFSRVLRTGQPIYDAPMTARLANGTVVDLSISAAPLSGLDNAIAGIVGAFTDITDRKRAEAELHETHNRLSTIVETTPGVVCAFRLRPDGSTCIPYGAERIEALYGLASGVLATDASAIFLQMHPDDAGHVRETLAASAGALTRFRCEWRLHNPVRGEIWVEVHSMPRREPDGSIVWYGVVTDVTERKDAEAQIRESAEALRALWRRMNRLREERNLRIAREVHDELGQLLTALKMDVAWLDSQLARAWEDGRLAALRQKSASILELIDSGVQTVRRVAADLRPPMIDDLGLVAAIEWQVQEFQKRSGIACRLTAPADAIVIDVSRATALYRILQETLTNVARHAAATHIDIALSEDAGSVALRVTDNGRGITAEAAASLTSIGLLGMRERAEAFGGTVRVARAEPQGTVVEARIPAE